MVYISGPCVLINTLIGVFTQELHDREIGKGIDVKKEVTIPDRINEREDESEVLEDAAKMPFFHTLARHCVALTGMNASPDVR